MTSRVGVFICSFVFAILQRLHPFQKQLGVPPVGYEFIVFPVAIVYAKYFNPTTDGAILASRVGKM